PRRPAAASAPPRSAARARPRTPGGAAPPPGPARPPPCPRRAPRGPPPGARERPARRWRWRRRARSSFHQTGLRLSWSFLGGQAQLAEEVRERWQRIVGVQPARVGEHPEARRPDRLRLRTQRRARAVEGGAVRADPQHRQPPRLVPQYLLLQH